MAPRNSLFVEGSLNYPTSYRNYEFYTHAPINRESLAEQKIIAADPVGVLSRWLDNKNYAATFLIFTRSQQAEIDMVGNFAAGTSLGTLENAIKSSPKFRLLYGNEDAQI